MIPNHYAENDQLLEQILSHTIPAADHTTSNLRVIKNFKSIFEYDPNISEALNELISDVMTHNNGNVMR
jgi:hypothetical protein